MSHENVELVRRLLDAFNRQDATGAAELWASTGDWYPAFIGGGLVEGAVFRGPEGASEFVELQSETWGRVVAEPMAMREVGDHVLVEVHLQAVGRVSGTPVDRVTWNLFRVRDGKIATGRVYTSREEALEAVGLAE